MLMGGCVWWAGSWGCIDLPLDDGVRALLHRFFFHRLCSWEVVCLVSRCLRWWRICRLMMVSGRFCKGAHCWHDSRCTCGHDAFITAAKAEADTEFVLTTVPEVAQMFINPPLVAVSKQEPERFSAFGMDVGFLCKGPWLCWLWISVWSSIVCYSCVLPSLNVSGCWSQSE